MSILLKNEPAYSFKKEKLNIKTENIPGPGNYNYNYNFIGKNNKYIFPKSKRENYNKYIIPGPGEYYKDKYVKIKGGTINKEQAKINSDEIPGPGNYKIDYNTLKKGIKIPISKKTNFEFNNETGPGDYYPNYNKILTNRGGEGSILNKASRNIINKNIEIPGPGFYNSNVSTMNKGVIISKSHIKNFNDKNDIGPGYYEHWKYSVKNRFKGGLFNKSKINIKTENNIGPGEYNSNNTKFLKKCPIIKFNKSKRILLNQKEDLPGPGSYNINSSSLNKMGNYKIKSLRNRELKDNLPGPGNYYYNYSYLKKGILIPKSKTNIKLEKIPGPGDYDTDNYYKKSYKFPLSKAIFKNNNNENPGVGKYNLDQAFNYISKSHGIIFPKSKREK